MTKQLTAGVPATISVVLVDDNGAAVNATAVSWKLYDGRGVELATGAATGFTAGDAAASIALSAVDTEIDTPQAPREVVLTCSTASGDVEVRDFVLLVSTVPLTVMVNTFQTQTEAVLTRAQFAKLSGWDNATKTNQIAAMQEAYRRILRVSLQLPRSAYTQASQFWPNRRVVLSRLTATEFDALPAGFREALKRAQMAEANVLLGGDPIGDRIRSGMVSETVGESSMFLNSKPYLNLPISKQAYEELKSYAVFVIRVARA